MISSVKINLVSRVNAQSMLESDKEPSGASIVAPGDNITTSDDFMRGHGTYITPGAEPGEKELNSSLAGVVERIDKLISVRPLKTRYQGKIGDVIVGRIVQVQQRRWKVDVNGHINGQLGLTSVNLPGGELRRRDELDELSMRKHLKENDLITAEVQKVYTEAGGMVALHTRSVRYGKLGPGILVKTSPSLIKPRKNHFHTFPFGVSLVIGNNGYIWVYPTITEENPNAEIPLVIRESVTRVRNCLLVLSKFSLMIYDTSVLYCYEYSQTYTAKELLDFGVQKDCAHATRTQLLQNEQ